MRLSTDALVAILERYAAAVGIDPTGVAGRSTRRGAATRALRNGSPLHRVADQPAQRALSSTRGDDADAQAAVHDLTGALGC